MSRKLLYEEVVELIQEYIIEKQLEPEQRLPTEEELAEKFNVSRTSVREAMKTMVGLGFLDIQRGRGIFVKEPRLIMADKLMINYLEKSIGLMELLDVREVLELGSIDLVLNNITKDQLNSLTESIEKLQKIIDKDKDISYEDMLFHLIYLESTNNKVIIELSNFLREFFNQAEIEKTYNRTKGLNQKTLNDHIEIYYAIKNKDKNRLSKILKEHILNRRCYLFNDKDNSLINE